MRFKNSLCGTSAGNKSAERKEYYASASNLFYSTLNNFGLTPKLLKPNEYYELLNYGLGLTDLAKHNSGMDKSLKINYYDTESFITKILRYQPKIVCFNGKEAAKVVLQFKRTKEIGYGMQVKTIGYTKLYVAPSTSGLARPYWDVRYWQRLIEFV